MVRVKRGKAARRRRKRLFEKAKGFRGGLGNQIRRAHQAVFKALTYATRHRKTRKREMRSLWIARINAAVKNFGLNYSRFISALKKHKILLDRRSLADLAVSHPRDFARIVEVVQGK